MILNIFNDGKSRSAWLLCIWYHHHNIAHNIDKKNNNRYWPYFHRHFYVHTSSVLSIWVFYFINLSYQVTVSKMEILYKYCAFRVVYQTYWPEKKIIPWGEAEWNDFFHGSWVNKFEYSVNIHEMTLSELHYHVFGIFIFCRNPEFWPILRICTPQTWIFKTNESYYPLL